MKYFLSILISLLVLSAQAQEKSYTIAGMKDSTNYKIVLNSGKVHVGMILKQDSREVLIETKEVGQILIPKFEISLIEQISEIGRAHV